MEYYREHAHCSICDAQGHTAADTHCTMCSVHPAPHKVGEEGWGTLHFHNLTARFCCTHFREVIGDCQRWPTYAHGQEWPQFYEPWRPPPKATVKFLSEERDDEE